MTTLRIGTRGSALATAQATTVMKALAKATGGDVELVTVTTHGDTSRESLSSLGGTGVFASALRDALLGNECDVVVHSLKDLPTAAYPGLVIGATPRREDARDALCARDGTTLPNLPEGAKVGTGSPRRAAQLRATRPDIQVVDIRGNIDTRLRRVTGSPDADDALDAVVLARAGLTRLDRTEAITQSLSLSEWPSAPGQGALAVEVRDGDERHGGALAKALASINHVTTRGCVGAERLVLAGLEAGCAAPIGASAIVDDGMLFVTSTVYSLDGAQKLTSSHAATLDGFGQMALDEAARDTSSRIVEELLKKGAADIAPLSGA